MDSQIKMNLHSDKYLTDLPQKEMDRMLRIHCTKLGFPVGVENIMDLPETGFAAARNDSFGASDSAVLLGVAYSSKKVPMKTKDELLFEKVNSVWNTEIGKLASVRKGKELEDMIIHKLEKVINAKILKPADMYINNQGLATNFDGVIFEAVKEDLLVTDYKAVPMEIKVCSFFGRKNYDWKKGVSEFEPEIKLEAPIPLEIDTRMSIEEYIKAQADWYGIPKYYYTQLQQQILFLGSDHGHLAVMDDINWEIFIYTIPRDDHMISELLKESYYQYESLLQC